MTEHRFAYSARNLTKLSSFSGVTNFESQDCQWYGVKRISIFVDMEISATRFVDLFITSNSSYFFNKTDLEKYLFKMAIFFFEKTHKTRLPFVMLLNCTSMLSTLHI